MAGGGVIGDNDVDMAPVSVLVVDDQPPFLRAATNVVGLTPGFEVVGQARSGEEAVDLAGALHPQMVLMDINMDGMGGIEATRHLTTGRSGPIVILLSTYRENDLPADARNCGAAAYVHKEDFGSVVLERVWAEHLANASSDLPVD
jgi:two-component system invasion response regulator UvrY